jgi:SAM-dependent methyltransferase
VQYEEHPDYPGAEVLSEIDANLVNYSRGIVQLLFRNSQLSGKKSPSVLDFGAGAGSLTRIWQEISSLTPDCVELDPNLRSALHEKGFTAVPDLASLLGTYDFIYSSNVLEHIENDQGILNLLVGKLAPDGVIGIYVPAFQFLYTDFDKSVGHFRRYRKKDLQNKVELAGAQILTSKYCDSVGFFAIGVLKLIGYKFTENSTAPKMMRFYDKFIVPVSNLMDWVGFRYLLGKNVLVIARKN